MQGRLQRIVTEDLTVHAPASPCRPLGASPSPRLVGDAAKYSKWAALLIVSTGHTSYILYIINQKALHYRVAIALYNISVAVSHLSVRIACIRVTFSLREAWSFLNIEREAAVVSEMSILKNTTSSRPRVAISVLQLKIVLLI